MGKNSKQAIPQKKGFGEGLKLNMNLMLMSFFVLLVCFFVNRDSILLLIKLYLKGIHGNSYSQFWTFVLTCNILHQIFKIKCVLIYVDFLFSYS